MPQLLSGRNRGFGICGSSQPGLRGVRSGGRCGLVFGGERSVAGRTLVRRMKGFEEVDERGHFFGREILSVSRHVAAALNDLADELIFGEAHGYGIEFGAAPATDSIEGVAVAALHSLEDDGSLALNRREVLQILCGNGVLAPGVHFRTPGSAGAEIGEDSPEDRDGDEDENRDGAAMPALFTFPCVERESDEDGE